MRGARAVAQLLDHLPRSVKRAVGGTPIVVDGEPLDPTVQIVLRMISAMPGSDFTETPEDEGRKALDREALIFGGAPLPVDVESLTVPSADGPIPARMYRPCGSRPAGLVIYFHGGGWVLGGLESHDATCSFLASNADVCVMSVDYRLAPEHPFPAGVDDAVAAFRFAVEHADALGIDPSAIAVAGDSAGGNLSAVVAQVTAATGEQSPALQVLLAPVVDMSVKRPSYKLFGTGFFLDEHHMDWYRERYLTDPDQALDPRVSPLLAEDVSGVASAYVAVAGFDVLRDEGIAYARRLREAGVPTVLRNHATLVHPFPAALTVGACRDAVREIVAAIRFGLAHADASRSA
ncbi:putative lipase/esterase LipN [Gordonia spumicola]|uniref:Putative lipase/esterase LipN n=1 Tax=Gordonia spumicola TaxID=589161 RepID=A0A7I9VEJ9_9ACTN|nr:putative lipase/esterase LipN [Gordonia spumicola]